MKCREMVVLFALQDGTVFSYLKQYVPKWSKWVCIVLLLYVWPELTTPKFGGAYSQQPPVRFSFRKLCAVLYCLKDCTQVSEWKSHRWLLRISTVQFLHAEFGKIFENKIINNFLFRETHGRSQEWSHKDIIPHSFTVTLQNGEARSQLKNLAKIKIASDSFFIVDLHHNCN
jgi:hypothetical protein